MEIEEIKVEELEPVDPFEGLLEATSAELPKPEVDIKDDSTTTVDVKPEEIIVPRRRGRPPKHAVAQKKIKITTKVKILKEPKVKLVKTKNKRGPRRKRYETDSESDGDPLDNQPVSIEDVRVDFLETPNGRKKFYFCPKCDYKSNQLTNLQRHYKTMHFKKRSHKCMQCNYRASDIYYLNRHILQKHTGVEPKKCSFCDYKTTQINKLREHVEKKHPEEVPKKCAHCEFFTIEKQVLENHIRRKHFKLLGLSKKIKEDTRNVKMKLQNARSEILLTETGQTKRFFFCPKCNYKSDYLINLRRHFKMIHYKSTSIGVKCSKCGYRAANSMYLQRHMEQKHSQMYYFCSYCYYKTAEIYKLRYHGTKRHSTERQLLCHLCEFISYESAVLEHHLLKKHNKKVPTIQPKLQESPGTRNPNEMLFSYLNIAEDNEVDLSSVRSDYLLTPGGSKKYFFCPQCVYKSTHLGNIQRHFKSIHYVVNQQKCPYCKYTTPNVYYFKRHVLKVHSKMQANPNRTLPLDGDMPFANSVWEDAKPPKIKPQAQNLGSDLNFIPSLNPAAVVETNNFENDNFFDDGLPEPNNDSDSENESLDPSLLEEDLRKIKADYFKLENGGKRKYYMCPRCSYKSNQLVNAQRHVKVIHFKIKELQCEHCTYKTSHAYYLRKHMLKKHQQGGYKICALCNYKSLDLNKLKQHVKKKHTDLEYDLKKCPHCEFEPSEGNTLEDHITSQHADIPTIECIAQIIEQPEDSKEPESTKTLEEELENVNIQYLEVGDGSRKKYYFCPKCTYRSNQNTNLQRHFKSVHYRKNLLGCMVCNYKATDIYYLKRHMETKHTNKKQVVKCSFCKFKTADMSFLKKHSISKHSDLPKLSCAQCDFQTVEKFFLEKHMTRKHSQDLIGTCPYCSYTTRNKKYLKLHINRHTKAVVYSCNYCPYKTTHPYFLKQHIRKKHSSDDNIKNCTVCAFSTVNATELDHHMTKNHPEECLQRCIYCPFKSSKAATLIDHINNDHKELFNTLLYEYKSSSASASKKAVDPLQLQGHELDPPPPPPPPVIKKKLQQSLPLPQLQQLHPQLQQHLQLQQHHLQLQSEQHSPSPTLQQHQQEMQQQQLQKSVIVQQINQNTLNLQGLGGPSALNFQGGHPMMPPGAPNFGFGYPLQMQNYDFSGGGSSGNYLM